MQLGPWLCIFLAAAAVLGAIYLLMPSRRAGRDRVDRNGPASQP
jgi:hypothetical protein